MNRLCLALIALVLFCTTGVWAQTVAFDAAVGITPAQANTWTSVLYVNGTGFPMTHICSTMGSITVCTSPLPNITAALTASGPQTFEVSFKDAVFGEGAKSSPFLAIRPGVPANLRIQ